MSWIRWTSCLTGAAALAAMIATFSCTTSAPPKPSEPTQADMVKRGEYLTTVAGCNDCHTPGTLFGAPDFSRKLSGSELGWSGPWGTTYARNLTPDPETGLGKWTDDQIITAFRTGQRPDGTTLRPPMPWQDFAALTDEDARAVVALLRSLPPIVHKVPDALPPGQKPKGSFLTWPAPSAWDAPRTPPAGADTAAHPS